MQIRTGGAQLLIPGLTVIQPMAGVAGYAGPFDGITFAALYGMKRFLASYTGSLIRLRRSSDDTESDFGYDAVTGLLDTAAIATFIGGGSGFIKTWYDQSGNSRDVTQATATNQPLYVASMVNSLPGVRFDGNDNYLEKTGITLTLNDPCLAFAFNMVARTENDGVISMAATGANDYDSANGLAVSHGAATVMGHLRQGFANVVNHTASLSTGTWYVTTTTQIDGNAAIRLNGGAAASTDTYTDTAMSPNRIILSGRYESAAARFGQNDMTCVAVLDGLSTANHNTIGNELATLYGLTWGTVS